VTAARSIKVVINNFDITKIGLALLISALFSCALLLRVVSRRTAETRKRRDKYLVSNDFYWR